MQLCTIGGKVRDKRSLGGMGVLISSSFFVSNSIELCIEG
jgi:hypothetical protein